jgi:hypothetical protein
MSNRKKFFARIQQIATDPYSKWEELEADDTIRRGDQLLSSTVGHWIPVQTGHIGKPVSRFISGGVGLRFRRSIKNVRKFSTKLKCSINGFMRGVQCNSTATYYNVANGQPLCQKCANKFFVVDAVRRIPENDEYELSQDAFTTPNGMKTYGLKSMWPVELDKHAFGFPKSVSKPLKTIAKTPLEDIIENEYEDDFGPPI